MGSIKTIIFDIYNTLLGNETDEQRQDTWDFLSRWLSYHGVETAPADLRSLYLDLCNEEMSRSSEEFPEIEIGTIFSRILAPGGKVPPSDAVVAEMALLFRILTTNHLSPFPGVIAMLEALRGKVKLGIASNAQRLFTIPELGKFGMIDFFDAMVFSSEIGVCKPDPKIFTAALQGLSAEPGTALYVGDNLVADIYGAQSVGMETIWINRGQQHDHSSRIRPYLEVADNSALAETLLSMV